MTSVLNDEENKAARMKQKLMNDRHSKEETRSFVSFSRGNLSISHSDLEHGFNKTRFRPRRSVILSTGALIVALLCVGLEMWTLHCSLANAREIESLKRDVENLEHRIMEEDLLDKLKTLSKLIHGRTIDDESEDDEDDLTNPEYDYDDLSSLYDYSSDYHTPVYGARPSDFPHAASTLEPVPSPPDPTPIAELSEHLYSLWKAEAKHLNKSSRDELEKLVHDYGKKSQQPDTETTHHEEKATDRGSKQKRSANDRVIHGSTELLTTSSSHRRGNRNQTRRMIVSRLKPRENIDEDLIERNQTGSINIDRYPPKKYHSHARPDGSRNLPLVHQENLPENLSERQPSFDISERRRSTQLRRGMTRRHLRTPRQVYAVHYGADSSLFSSEDEHTGNGRARHANGVFKAWRASDWVSELGMSKHFSLAGDGRLTVLEPGLYLAYAQIHYLDEHDENGFHLLVNNRPILQCMIYSPGIGHKSRSCFSAQVTLLHAGDTLILKDVGSARYTLFQHDKSFFGLVKLGESRQQRHQQTQPSTQN